MNLNTTKNALIQEQLSERKHKEEKKLEYTVRNIIFYSTLKFLYYFGSYMQCLCNQFKMKKGTLFNYRK